MKRWLVLTWALVAGPFWLTAATGGPDGLLPLPSCAPSTRCSVMPRSPSKWRALWDTVPVEPGDQICRVSRARTELFWYDVAVAGKQRTIE